MSLNCFLVDICKKRQRFSERVKEFLLNSSAFQTNKQAHNNNHRCVNLEIPLSTTNPLPDLLPERKHNNWRLSSLYVARMVTKNLLYNPSMSTLLVLNSFRYSMAYPDLSNRNKPKWIHGVRNIDSVRVRENVELVAHISQVLDPLHLVESIIDKKLIKKRDSLGPFNHHIRLQKSFFKTRHVNDWLLRISVHPIIWKIILQFHNEQMGVHGWENEA